MASFGTKYGDPPRKMRHQIKGGPSKQRTGQLKATSKQLTYLANLGYQGSLELTRTEASDAIAILEHKRRGP